MEEKQNQGVPQEPTQQEPIQQEQPQIENKFPVIPVVIGIAVIALAIAGWFVYSSTQNQEQGAISNYVGNSPEECSRIQVICIEGLQRFDESVHVHSPALNPHSSHPPRCLDVPLALTCLIPLVVPNDVVSMCFHCFESCIHCLTSCKIKK